MKRFLSCRSEPPRWPRDPRQCPTRGAKRQAVRRRDKRADLVARKEPPPAHALVIGGPAPCCAGCKALSAGSLHAENCAPRFTTAAGGSLRTEPECQKTLCRCGASRPIVAGTRTPVVNGFADREPIRARQPNATLIQTPLAHAWRLGPALPRFAARQRRWHR